MFTNTALLRRARCAVLVLIGLVVSLAFVQPPQRPSRQSAIVATADGTPPPPAAPGQPPGGRGGGRGGIQTMTLTSSAWSDGGQIPTKYSQAGDQVSPP